jgi:hypothetical protein
MLSVSLGGPFLISPSVFSNVYMMLLVFVLCLVWPCCQCLWIVHSWFPLQFSLMFIWCCWYSSCVFVWPCCQCLWMIHSWFPLQFSLMLIWCCWYSSCVLCDHVVSVFGLSILDFPFSFLCLYDVAGIRPVSCVTMLPVSLDDPFLISPSVYSNVYMMLLLFVLCLVWPCC